MTKRFTVEKLTELEYGITKDGETLIGISLDKITAKYIVERWNELVEENEKLKKSYDISEDCNDSLSKENEELHQIQMEVVTERDSLRKENTNLFDENEQLNETFQILYEQYKDALKIIKNLKKENEDLKTTISNYMDCIDKLYIENERLKRKLEFEEYKNRSYNKE